MNPTPVAATDATQVMTSHSTTSHSVIARPRAKYAVGGLVLVVLLAALRIATAELPPLPWEDLRDAASLSTAILIESFPFIMLGILLSVVVRVWIPQLLWRILSANPALRRVAMSFIGTLLPVCECGNVPLARALLRQGLNQGDVLAFTLSAPLLNPVTIVTTYQAFGAGSVLWGRVLGGFVIAQVVAWFATRWTRPAVGSFAGEGSVGASVDEEPVGQQSAGEAACGCSDQHGHQVSRVGQRSRLSESMRIFRTETAVLMPPLIFGALMAGAIQVGVSRETLVLLGGDPVLSVLAMMALAFIVSICSSVDAFFALSLAAAFTPGALVAFLIFGAMVDVKMLLLLRTTFHGGVLVRMVVGVTVLCALIGMGVNLGVAA